MLEPALADPAREQRFLDRTRLRAMGQPEDIGMAAVYLASPARRFVTSGVLPVGGGATMAR